MSQENHATLAVLKAQYGALCRRLDEIRADVRAEQAETRAEMKEGFARMDKRYDGLEERVRKTEHQGTRVLAVIIPIVSGLIAALIAFSKELIALLR